MTEAAFSTEEIERRVRGLGEWFVPVPAGRVEKCYAGDPTYDWWAPNSACREAMLRSSGFRVIDRLPPELFVCKVAAVEDGAV